MEDDPLIDEIREVRHEISERFGHDPRRLVSHYIEFQEAFRERLVSREELERKVEGDPRDESEMNLDPVTSAD